MSLESEMVRRRSELYMRAGDAVRRRTAQRRGLCIGEPVRYATYEAELSDQLLATILTVDRDTELHDTIIEGLYVRLRTRGQATYWYIDPFDRDPSRRKIRLGSVSDYTVDQARLKALAVSEAHFTAEGAVKHQRQLSKSTLVSEAWRIYRDGALPVRATGRIERLLNPYLSTYGSERPGAAQRASLLRVIERVALADPNQGYEFHKQLRAFLSWCARSGLIESNPIALAPMPVRREKEAQVLNTQQLARIHRASLALTSPSRELVGFILLTGSAVATARVLRRDQVDLDLGFWTADVGSSRKATIKRPLSEMCIRSLKTLPVNQTYLFQSPYRRFPARPIHLSSNALDVLRSQSRTGLWSWHDLVKSVGRGIASCETSRQGAPSPLELRRDSLNAWTEMLTSPVADEDEGVVL